MKKLYALGMSLSLLTLTTLNAYAITATPLAPVDFTNAIPNDKPILLPQDPKHFLVYTTGEITLVDAANRSVVGTIPKPNTYENLSYVFALQSGNLLALDTTGLYLSRDMGKHWNKTSDDIFGDHSWSFGLLQSKSHPENLFAISLEDIFLSHDEGHTWKVIWHEKFFSQDFHPFDVYQATNGGIYILTHHGHVEFTQDEGQHWQLLKQLPPEPNYWMEKAFCSLNGDSGYVKFGKELYEIKSPQDINLIYTDKGDYNDCFVDNQQNLYATDMDKDATKTDITFIGQNGKTSLVNSFQGRIYNFNQDIEGKYYLNTDVGLAAAQTIGSTIDLYPAIFKQGIIHRLSVNKNNETNFVVQTGDDLFGPWDAYLSQDEGHHYTRFDKQYHTFFYFKGALNYLVWCDANKKQTCLNVSQDNGKTWKLIALPKEIKEIFGIDQHRGRLIMTVSQGIFLSSDLENWNAILTTDIFGSKNLKANLKAILKKHKPLFIATLKTKQYTLPQPVKSVKAYNVPHTDCLFFSLDMNVSLSNVFTLVQHSCRDDDDVYFSQDEGEHWTRANSDLPNSVLDSPFMIPMVFLDNGDLILEDYYGNTLLKSTDGGAHFKNLIKDLPPIELSGPDNFAHEGNSLFALGTDYGSGAKIYFSHDEGNTWERLDIINSLTEGLHFANNKLLIATRGDGIFSAKV